LLLIVTIGVARIYLQAHYFTDVVAGYVVGFFWTDVVILAGQLLSRGRSISRAGRTHATEVPTL
jgi:membrane-associated phospholipid phosphatase